MTFRPLAATVPLLLVLLSTPVHAEHPGASLHGAGGPLLAASWVWLPGGRQVALASGGGSGYAYFLDGRLRLGGGGQGSVASSSDQGWSGSVGWGGLILATDFLGEGRWEFPVGLMLGGVRVSAERIVEPGALERVERESFGFFSARAFAGAELRVARTAKVALQAGYQLGFHEGIALKGAELSLQLVFLLPRPGY